MAEVQPKSSLVGAGSMVAAGMMSMNVMVYAFTLLSAHTLDPAAFGGLGAVLALLIMISVGALALQATGARRIATAEPDLEAAVVGNILATTRALALGLGGLLVILSPLVRVALDVTWSVALMIPLAVVPLTFLGSYAGILQGRREWRLLTAVFVGLGLGRLVFGGAALLIEGSLPAAMTGLTVGAYVPALIGWLACRKSVARHPGSASALMREVWHNGHTLLAFFAFTNLDVLLARNLLSNDDSGLYAAGAILTKSCLFLPQFVIVVAFPGIAEAQAQNDRSHAWLRPLGLVAVIGLCVVLGTAILPSLAVTFVGGSAYAALEGYLWLFAVAGTFFALLQMIVYRQIARGAGAVAIWLWCAAACAAAAAFTIDRIGAGLDQQELVMIVILAATLVALPSSFARPRRTVLMSSVVPTSANAD